MAQPMVFAPTAYAPAPFAAPPAASTSCGACGGPLKVAVCGKGQNAGKTYSACANGAGPFCKKTFKWVDAPLVAVAQQPTGAVASGWPGAQAVAPQQSAGVTLQNVYDELQLLKVEVARLADAQMAKQHVQD